MNKKGDKTMIYIGDNLPNHDHPEENRDGNTIMKRRWSWRVVKSGPYWAVEMKISEQVRATLMTIRNEKPVWDDKEQAQTMADILNRR